MSNRTSSFEVTFLLLAATAGALISCLVQPFIHKNDAAISLLATVFSILAGLLIGIMTLLSDVSILSNLKWQGAVFARGILLRRLCRLRLLFVVYLATLVLLLGSILLPDGLSRAIFWLEIAYLFLGAIGFIYSFRLPWTLARIQEERLDSLIRERRHEAGLDQED